MKTPAFLLKHKREFLRLLPLLLVAGVILVPDTSSAVVWFTVGISLLLVAVSHILRKALFPYIDLEVYAKAALGSPMSAAIVFGSVVYILGVFISASTALLR